MLAVVDGMGGAPGGERASALVIAACESLPSSADDPRAWLRDRIEAARSSLAEDEHAEPSREGMGATIVLALVRDSAAWVAHAGDSRGYLWASSHLERLTEDHNVAAENVRAGRLTQAEAMHDPGRHRLTRAVLARAAQPEFAASLPLDDGSVLLLLSDGITGTVDDTELARCIEARCGRELVEALVSLAHERGAPDNIAIALLDSRC